MVLYRERLWPAPWLFISTALIIPACILVFAPINMAVGVILAIVLYAVCVWMLLNSAATIQVTEESFSAGRARIERSLLGNAQAYDGDEATLQRGQKLDARAWLLIRGWVKPVVKVAVLDVNDPAPYWLISTRRPGELVRVLSDLPGPQRRPLERG
ncbi:DUF3093 domain-containing protein [Rathayibacter soli]|uniref:DUF3093 domain-containing protein n=1 Tax=Rathayibacter soli TaxID=3144168 RepID=UPI0027E54BD8|nr:DUF3093 domain-containing protein [Glaciibacter superstes]